MGITSDITFYFSDAFKKLTVNELPKFQELADTFPKWYLHTLETIRRGK